MKRERGRIDKRTPGQRNSEDRKRRIRLEKRERIRAEAESLGISVAQLLQRRALEAEQIINRQRSKPVQVRETFARPLHNPDSFFHFNWYGMD